MRQIVQQLFNNSDRFLDAVKWLNVRWDDWKKLNQHELEDAVRNEWPEIVRRCGEEDWFAAEVVALSAVSSFLNVDGGIPKRHWPALTARVKAIHSAIDKSAPGNTTGALTLLTEIFEVHVPE
jgi:hypothetical protein